MEKINLEEVKKEFVNIMEILFERIKKSKTSGAMNPVSLRSLHEFNSEEHTVFYYGDGEVYFDFTTNKADAVLFERFLKEVLKVEYINDKDTISVDKKILEELVKKEKRSSLSRVVNSKFEKPSKESKEPKIKEGKVIYAIRNALTQASVDGKERELDLHKDFTYKRDKYYSGQLRSFRKPIFLLDEHEVCYSDTKLFFKFVGNENNKEFFQKFLKERGIGHEENEFSVVSVERDELQKLSTNVSVSEEERRETFEGFLFRGVTGGGFFEPPIPPRPKREDFDRGTKPEQEFSKDFTKEIMRLVGGKGPNPGGGQSRKPNTTFSF